MKLGVALGFVPISLAVDPSANLDDIVSVAQWIRASVSGTEGRRFESCRGHHLTRGFSVSFPDNKEAGCF